MPSFPTRLLEVLSKFRGVNVQQFLQVSCPTKSLGGVSCPTIFLVAAISGISFQQHPFWGGASLLSNMWYLFPKRLVPQTPDHPIKNLPQKIMTFGEGIQPMVIWGGSPKHTHAPPGPPVPRTMSEQNLPRLRGENSGRHNMSDAWKF